MAAFTTVFRYVSAHQNYLKCNIVGEETQPILFVEVYAFNIFRNFFQSDS